LWSSAQRALLAEIAGSMALRTTLLTLIGMSLLAACGDKAPPKEAHAAEATAPAPTPIVPIAPTAPTAPATDCPPRLRALLAALPTDDAMLGERLYDRSCSTAQSATVRYGTGEARTVSFTLTAFRVADTELAGGIITEDDARKMLDTLRKTQAMLLGMQGGMRQAAAATQGRDPDPMTAGERARLPRVVTLPGGGAGEVFFESDRWRLLVVFGDHHSLDLEVENAPWSTTDEAYPKMVELAGRVKLDAIAQ
jgi:hypothetical protein